MLATAIGASVALSIIGGAARPSSGQERTPPEKKSKPEYTTVDPRRSAVSGSPARYEPWIPRIANAERALERGARDDARGVFEELLAADRTNPIARRYLVEILVAEGDFDGARSLANRSRRNPPSRPPVPLEHWWVLGPFAWRGHAESLREVYGPEKDPVRFDERASFSGDGRICRWKPAGGPRVDFRDLLGLEDAAVGYAFCPFVARRSGWVRIGFASADGMKAWLNGNQILDAPGRRDIHEDDDLVWAFVRRGANRLLIKVESDGGAFRAYAQVYDDIPVPESDFLDAAIAAEKALSSGRTDEAEIAYLEAEKIDPGHPDIALGLARVSLESGNPVAARSWALRALESRPGSAAALAVHAESLFLLGDPVRGFDAIRSAYVASGRRDAALHERWVAWARRLESPLEEAVAELERARGLFAAGKEKEARELVEVTRPRLEESFVGLAELSELYRERGERDDAVDLALRALGKLSPDQRSTHCSAEWIVDLSRIARAPARERLIEYAEKIAPAHPAVLGLRLEELAKSSGVEQASERGRIAALLAERPGKDALKLYAKWLLDRGLHEEVISICRAGLEAGIVSRKLRLWLGESLIELRRWDEAEESFRELLSEPDYEEAARRALEKIRSSRS